MDGSTNGNEYQDEIDKLIKEDPNHSAGYAVFELVHGRLDWLALHIRLCDYKIDKSVAETIMHLIDGTHSYSEFQLTMKRKEGIPSAKLNKRSVLVRNFELAIEVAKLGGFDSRGALPKACEKVSKRRSQQLGVRIMAPEYMAKLVRPHREKALAAVAERRMQEAYDKGLIDVFGKPIPQQRADAGTDSAE